MPVAPRTSPRISTCPSNMSTLFWKSWAARGFAPFAAPWARAARRACISDTRGATPRNRSAKSGVADRKVAKSSESALLCTGKRHALCPCALRVPAHVVHTPTTRVGSSIQNGEKQSEQKQSSRPTCVAFG